MEHPTPMQISALRALRQYHRERGIWPRSADWTAWRNTEHPEAPSQDQISRAWHTWLQALAVAGAPWDLLVTRGLNRWDRAHLPQVLAAIPWDQFPDDVRPLDRRRVPDPPPAVVPTIATRQMLGPEEVRAMESTWALVWSTLDRATQWTWFRDSPAHPSSAGARFPTSWAPRIRRAMQQNPRAWMAYIHPTWLDAMARTSEQRWPDLSNALAWWSNEHWPSALCYFLALYRIRNDADELTVLHWLETHALAHPTEPPGVSYQFSRRFSMPCLTTPAVRPIQRPNGRRPTIIVVGEATHRGFCRQLVEREFGCRLRFYEGQDAHAPKHFPHADGVILAINQTSHEFDDKLHRQFANPPRGFFLTIPQGGQSQLRQAMQTWAQGYQDRGGLSHGST